MWVGWDPAGLQEVVPERMLSIVKLFIGEPFVKNAHTEGIPSRLVHSFAVITEEFLGKDFRSPISD